MSEVRTARILEIPVIAKKVEIKKGNNKGKSFIAFKAVEKNGKLVDLSFTMDVTNQPKEEGRFTLKVKDSKINFDKNTLWGKYWIKELIGFVAHETISKVDETAVNAFQSEADLPF